MTILILIRLLFFCSALQGFQLAGAGTGTRPEDVANRFESHSQSALQTLVNFGRETKTPLGLFSEIARYASSISVTVGLLIDE